MEPEMTTISDYLDRIEQALTIPAAEYVPAIGDVFNIIKDARASLDAHLSEPDASMGEDEAARLDAAFDRMRKQRNALQERLFDALKSDPILKEGLEEVDHALHINRMTYSRVLDVACAQKARADEAEAKLAALSEPDALPAPGVPNIHGGPATYSANQMRDAMQAAAQPVAWIRWEWNRSGSRSLVFEKPGELSLAEEATGVVYDPLYAATPPAGERSPEVQPLALVNVVREFLEVCNAPLGKERSIKYVNCIKTMRQLTQDAQPFTYAQSGPRLELDGMIAALVQAVYDACEKAATNDEPLPAIDDVGLKEGKAIQRWAFKHLSGAGERSTPAEPQGWLSMDSAPKDGTCVLLRIEGGEHPMQDDDPSVSIGSYDTEGGPEEDPTWNFTGWTWHQDCYCRGTGTVTGWLPLPPTTPKPKGGEQP
jgi:hypothetical protein